MTASAPLQTPVWPGLAVNDCRQVHLKDSDQEPVQLNTSKWETTTNIHETHRLQARLKVLLPEPGMLDPENYCNSLSFPGKSRSTFHLFLFRGEMTLSPKTTTGQVIPSTREDGPGRAIAWARPAGSDNGSLSRFIRCINPAASRTCCLERSKQASQAKASKARKASKQASNQHDCVFSKRKNPE